MRSHRQSRVANLVALALAILLAGCIVAWYWTRGATTTPAKATATASLIDERLLQTAHQLASQADTADEQACVRDALRLADHELDQAFATALRSATASTPPKAGPAKQLADRIEKFKARVAADQARLANVSKGDDSDQVDLAKAQLALDQDELDDAQQDLARQGGDQRANVQQALQQHEAAQQDAQLPKPAAAAPAGTLSEQVRLWLALGSRDAQLNDARQQASAKAATLTREHDALEKPSAPQPAEDDTDAAETIARLRILSDQHKTLAELDKRIQDCQQLATAYQHWDDLVQNRRRGILHLMLASFGAALGVLLAVVLIDRSIRHAFSRQTDPRRLHQLRVMATVGVQAVGAMLIVVIAFGPPNQLSTIIGFSTAGLTIALKDFIVAFFGWFALMGKNGIRIGDWVEINGIGGEVIEIGIFKTVLLEMGNWTNTGHPTGRHVAFMNSFAIENHYFNFSTAGQWLWDELLITLPMTGNPYQTAQRIRDVVEQETEVDAREAERDWDRVTHQYGTRAFSAKPVADLRPSVNGLDVAVRYITRAPQRYEVKSRLFQVIVDLLHGTTAAAPA